MVAVLDTSVVVAIAFGEPSRPSLLRRLRRFDALFASPLLEAELRATCARAGAAWDARLVQDLRWLTPPGRLTREIERVLDAGRVRGADCWHLATALWFAPEPSMVTFVTLDVEQRGAAAALGFTV
jgi:predicted nucleic acid-binding protein